MTDRNRDETLDPQDWEAFRTDARRILDDTIDYLQGRREEPVWQRMPDTVRQGFSAPAPDEGQSLATTYAEYRATVRPYLIGNNHPRFWGWVNGNGTPTAMLAEMLAASIDPNCAGADQAPRDLELQVVRWFAEAYGLPSDCGGLMVSGGSEANLVCLAAARQRMDPDARRLGVDPARADLVFYCSAEAHFSIGRALEVLGLGADSLRHVPCGDDGRVDVSAVRAAIAEDRAAGRRPAAICANLGTVNTGAIDPLNDLADLAEQEQIWLHIDGAFGALLALSDSHRDLAAGMERADSVAFDLHKWAYQPYECACALVRDGSVLDDAFGFDAPYLDREPGGMLDVDFGLAWRGVQLSRGFKALKIWFTIKQEGMTKLGRMIDQNCAQAQRLTEWIVADPRLELLAPTVTCVVNFRLHPSGMDNEAELDALNQRIVAHLHNSGLAVPSATRVHGRYAIRPAYTNHRTTEADLRLFMDAVVGFAIE
jgi:aromatic-L-amino-acid/L-tryptophan decarboxylase